jgi:hypothetical protein
MTQKTKHVAKNQVHLEWSDRQLPELEEAVQIIITTKCPSKYILVDMETAQVYLGTDKDNPYMENTKLWEEQRNIKGETK